MKLDFADDLYTEKKKLVAVKKCNCKLLIYFDAF